MYSTKHMQIRNVFLQLKIAFIKWASLHFRTKLGSIHNGKTSYAALLHHFQGLMGRHSGGQTAGWNWHLDTKLTSCNTQSNLSTTTWPMNWVFQWPEFKLLGRRGLMLIGLQPFEDNVKCSWLSNITHAFIQHFNKREVNRVAYIIK